MAKPPTISSNPPVDPPIAPPLSPPAPPVTAADAIKERPAAATQPVVDRVQTTTGASGEPSSATISTEPVPSLADAVLGVVTERSFRERDGGVTYAGSLPASRRVLPNGREQTVTARLEDTSERLFTAAIRILRSKTLYEPGAPVPLTRREFEAKLEARAIVELEWRDGEDVED